MITDAILSEDGVYRYVLMRRWSDRAVMIWCMLNPSTADAHRDDPTIRRCIHFAAREGYGGIHVVNLMAYRATDPKECLRQADPFGPQNDEYLEQAVRIAPGGIVCAWGSKAPDWVVLRGLRHLGDDLRCLGMTRTGHPRHPLYVSGLQPLVEFRGDLRIRVRIDG